MNKNIKPFAVCTLLFALCVGGDARAAAPLSGTAGSNLTAFNGGMGALNNNTWNTLTNERATTSGPTADFGNCNALILRCAQPKCANGGCLTMDIAYPIVSGCVLANESCKKHGEPLIQTIAAQMVAASTAKANEQAAAAQAASAAQSAAAADAQYQQMQMQMQQMQSQMAQQNAQQIAQLEAALEEQKSIAQQAANEAAAREAAARTAATVAAVATSPIEAAEKGVSADVLAREQASGKILDSLDKAQISLNGLKKTMQNTFDYAGCDASGNNCSGPKRVKVFKQNAIDFFDPYETVLDEVYDALIMAQSLGVDITDIYMMLNGTCNVWGKYLCSDGQTMHYTGDNCKRRGDNTYLTSDRGARCTVGQVIPMNDGGCQLIQMLNNNEEVQQNWLYPEQNLAPDGVTVRSEVRVGCASEALDNSNLFRGRKKQASIDIDTLRRMIEQDAPTRAKTGEEVEWLTRYCATGTDDIYKLQTLVQNKSLTTTGLEKICVRDGDLKPLDAPAVAIGETSSSSRKSGIYDCNNSLWANTDECLCENSGGSWLFGCNCGIKKMNYSTKKCEFVIGETNNQAGKYNPLYESSNFGKTTNKFDTSSTNSMKRNRCIEYGGKWNSNYCDCTGVKQLMLCNGLNN